MAHASSLALTITLFGCGMHVLAPPPTRSKGIQIGLIALHSPPMVRALCLAPLTIPSEYGIHIPASLPLNRSKGIQARSTVLHSLPMAHALSPVLLIVST